MKSGGTASSYTFNVPYTGCGTKPSCTVCASVDNILVIQSDEDLQAVRDTARKITCDYHATTGGNRAAQHKNNNDNALTIAEKTIIFKPFVVDMLEVVSVPTAKGGVDCWMDIQRGEFPNVQPLSEIIKIGETLSVLVFLRDPKHDYDIIVRDCYGFDNDDYEATTTSRIQLSDKRGCSKKPQIFGNWQKTI